MNIKQNEHNSTSKTILLSNDLGQGKTSNLPELYSFESDTTFKAQGYDSVELSKQVLQALFIKNLHAEFKNSNNLQDVLDCYSRDYLGVFHQRTSNKTDKKTNPVRNSKSVITGEQYYANCITGNLDVKNKDRILDLISRVQAVTSSTTKQELTVLVNDFSFVFFSQEQETAYKTIVEAEKADQAKFEGLTAEGFKNINRSGTTIQAEIALESASKGVQSLDSIGFSLVSSRMDLEKGLAYIVFSEQE